MKTLWLMYKLNFKLAIREFSTVIFGILMPAGLIILLGFLDDTDMSMSFAAVATLGISSVGLMGLPLTLSDYRQRKILKRYKVTPVSPSIVLASHVLYCFTLSYISMGLVYVLAALLFNYTLTGSSITFIFIFLLVTSAMHAIGMIIASLAKNEQMAGVIASLIYFPMILLSGATIPLTVFPDGFQFIANFLPLTHGINLLSNAVQGNDMSNELFSLALLAVVTISGVIISLKYFKWE